MQFVQEERVAWEKDGDRELAILDMPKSRNYVEAVAEIFVETIRSVF